jgi:transcriptional regulator
MYTPAAFRDANLASLHAVVREAGLCSLVTATSEGLIATPMPMFLDGSQGGNGVLCGHIARANPQWSLPPVGDAMAIFMGPDAYISPSWYEAKRETGKVVPTWNYVAVHAYGPVEFFDDADRLRDVVTRLTEIHERSRIAPWAVADAPEDFICAQLRAIVGVRMPIARLEGKCKMSQNRSAADRAAVAEGLASSGDAADRAVATLVAK